MVIKNANDASDGTSLAPIIANSFAYKYNIPATCSDGIKNQDETSVDIGGVCGTCFDGSKNGNETNPDF